VPKKSRANINNSKPQKQSNARTNKPKRTVTPKFLINPETDEPVWIQTATLQDIQQATRRKRPPWAKANRFLVTVPSLATRQTIYETAAAALQELEERVLPTYGGRPWQCIVTLSEAHKQKSPYFVWHKKGLLELAAWPHLVEKMPNPPRFPGYYVGGGGSSSRRKPNTTPAAPTTTTAAAAAAPSTAAANEDDGSEEAESEEEGEEEEEEEVVPEEIAALHELQEREASGLSELAWQNRNRVPLPTVSYKWISPLRQTFNSRKSAWEHAIQLCKQEIVLDKVLTGYGANGKALKLAPPTRKAVMEAGKMRFERDGLWVVGQEEAWGLERLEAAREVIASRREEINGIVNESKPEATATAPVETDEPKKRKRSLTGLTYFVQCNREELRQKRLEELRAQHEVENAKPENVPAAAAAATTSSSASASSATTPSIAISVSQPAPLVSPEPVSPLPQAKPLAFTLREADQELKIVFRALPEQEQQLWTTKAKARQVELDQEEVSKQQAQGLKKPVPQTPAAEGSLGNIASRKMTPADNSKKFAVVVEVDGASPPPLGGSASGVHKGSTCGSVVSASPTPHAVSAESSIVPKAVAPRPFDAVYDKKLADFSRSRKWCLNEEQIQLCYDAGMEHYDQVMRTVTARGLVSELQDGFDLLRERGRGRFDMELPVFDSPPFSFLNDTKTAPWMPVVREILGKDAVLIHKGMFLSMPGAEKQNYHQDGTHLSTQYQKPCHAINVFVPLVDLTADNGPTEFCLGSHVLGHEDFDEKFVEIPTAKAGTPVIFDYRLGHRGLANGSKTCRPIVYCTYAAAADGKEFRDSVNFSRKRYHRIGDLVEKGMTRDERASKRKRAMEEKREQEELEMVKALSQQEESTASRPTSSVDSDSGNHMVKKPRN